MRLASGSASAKTRAPPMTHSSAAPAVSVRACSMLPTYSTPGADPVALRLSTKLRLPGSALPIDSKVRRPISTGLPNVTTLKYFRSSGRCQGRAPSRPITPLSAMATTSAARVALAGASIGMSHDALISARFAPSELDLRGQHDHAAFRHTKKLRGLRAAPLHPRKQASPQALVAAAASWHHQVPAEEERAVLREQLQSAGAALFEREAYVRRLHEAEARGHGIHLGHQHFDAHAIGRVLARGAGDIHVQEHDALVRDMIVLEVA